MKYLKYLLVLVCVFFISCSGKEKTQSEGELAAVAAKGYYDELLKGEYETFVDSRYQTDSIPSLYREQLIANMKMYISQQNDEHSGIKNVNIVNANADTIHHTANVFLTLEYGDKTTEQVVVPMVRYKGKWLMR